MPLLDPRWLSALRVIALCAAAVACIGLLFAQPGVMMLGLMLAVLSGCLVVLQASLHDASLRRSPAGTCKVCGYEHGLTGASPPRCPECGSSRP